MPARIITTIPTFNSETFLEETLRSLRAQRLQPDRVVVLDDGSKDRTESIVKSFTGLPLEFVSNRAQPGLFENFNRCLDLAPETEFLHILHADDLVEPGFYEVLTQAMNGATGRALGWCLDERIDGDGKPLSLSGKSDGRIEVLDKDAFLARKAEIGNQAFCATLLRTNHQPTPARFPTDMAILGDMVFWPSFGVHCDTLVSVQQPLAKYRWHGGNQTVHRAPSVKALVDDEWATMKIVEGLRARPSGALRWAKLKGLLAVRAGIKSKRFHQLGNHEHARNIARTACGCTGLPLWLAGQTLVEIRELLVFKLGGRPRHPQNIFS